MPLGILLNPTFDLSDCFARVSLVIRQKESFGESRQMLMPVQLMNDLRIGRGCVHEIVVCPIPAWPLKAGDGIAMPIDVGAERNIRIGEQIHSMLAQNAGALSREIEPLRIMLPDKIGDAFAVLS